MSSVIMSSNRLAADAKPAAVAAAPRRLMAGAGVAGVVVLALLPLVAGGYWTYTLGLCFANAIAIISVSFLVRYGGEVSIGHGVFVAAGAYTVALMEKYLGVSLLASLPLAAVSGAFLGLLFAYPSRYLSGIYLAVATMALALALPEVLLHFSSVSGGYEGLYVKLDALPGIAKETQRYYLPLAGLVAVALLLRHFRRSRQAMALLLIRASPHAAESFGVRRSWARVSCMALSGAIAAIAGALLSFSSSTVSPNSFTLWTSIFLLVGSVVSLYSMSILGSLLGGLFLTLMPLLLAGAGDWVPILYGTALLGVVLGVNALPAKLRARLHGGNP
ncbi:branched-chain amino acid ABC transporter permease [Achromobacter sp. MFA1 R4]|uniref:branched-chain amino acid ABC transporter permease n=1 Tax=Achromobacter sp. MFA1 R4 TaxID=1881016 RepID=UPI00095392C9|nr:branched-chain amino acid ABC transporter permease [Achromobacter sp. MFA1 R4]SIT02022.1 branched-chain amino acid transport system permease protein [Achromobacter sp. MFA1 R4]